MMWVGKIRFCALKLMRSLFWVKLGIGKSTTVLFYCYCYTLLAVLWLPSSHKMQTCEMIDCNVLGSGFVGFGSPSMKTLNQLSIVNVDEIFIGWGRTLRVLNLMRRDLIAPYIQLKRRVCYYSTHSQLIHIKEPDALGLRCKRVRWLIAMSWGRGLSGLAHLGRSEVEPTRLSMVDEILPNRAITHSQLL